MSNIWNDENESLLRFWKEVSNVHIWLSNKASEFYNFINKLISIPCILISAVSSTTILSNIYEDECINIVQDDDNLSESIQGLERNHLDTGLLVIGCFLALGTFLQSLKEFLNLDSKISKFNNNIKTNRILILDIEEQLYLEKSERESPIKMIKKIKEIKKNLVTNTPVIPNFIKKRLKLAIERNEVLDIMSKSILYSYLKNQTIEIDGTMFNQNNTNNFNTNNQPSFKNYSSDNNQVDSPAASEDSHILIETNIDNISNLDSTYNLDSKSKLDSTYSLNNNRVICDFDSNIKEKILTNLHSL